MPPLKARILLSFVTVSLLYAAPRNPQKTLVAGRPCNPRFAIFASSEMGSPPPFLLSPRISLTRYGPSWDYGILCYRFYCTFRFINARVNQMHIADTRRNSSAWIVNLFDAFQNDYLCHIRVNHNYYYYFFLRKKL